MDEIKDGESLQLLISKYFKLLHPLNILFIEFIIEDLKLDNLIDRI